MKTYAVIGLGHFGYHVALGLAEQGLNVIAVDESKEKINSISNIVENTYILDSTDKKALQQAGLVELDVVVVAMGESVEASILTIMALRDLGNQTIIAKAMNPIHGEVLSKIGANKVVYPEKETAKRVVKNIASQVVFEVIDISNTIKGIKFDLPKGYDNWSIQELVPILEGAKIIAYKSEGKWVEDVVDESKKLKYNDTVFVLGRKGQIERIYEKILR